MREACRRLFANVLFAACLPVGLASACEVIDISASSQVTAILREDGTAWYWGGRQPNSWPSRLQGELVPKRVDGLPPVVDVWANSSSVLFVTEAGELWTLAVRTFDPVPTRVEEFAGVVEIKRSSATMALLDDGTLFGYGSNRYGENGVGSQNEVRFSSPRSVEDESGAVLDRVVRFSRPSLHVLAIRDDGSLWAWGRGQEGQLGVEQSLGLVRTRAEQLDLGVAVQDAEVGSYYSIALDVNGQVWTWGQDTHGVLYGVLGRDPGPEPWRPAVVPGLPPMVSVHSSGYTSFAVDESGGLWSWGTSGKGESGQGVFAESSAPQVVPALLAGVADVEGRGPTIARLDDGSLRTWGHGDYGGHGVGNIQHVLHPARVVDPLGGTATRVQALARSAVSEHSLAVVDEEVLAWGSGDKSALGRGRYVWSNAPAVTPSTTGATAVAAGFDFSVAARSGQPTLTWGHNSRGQAGTDSCCLFGDTPQASLNAAAIALAAGEEFVLALRPDETVEAWGTHFRGQLGNAALSGSASHVPVPVDGLTEIVSIAAGREHSLACDRGGRVYSWGRNADGQLGLAPWDDDDRDSPVEVNGVAEVVQVTATERSSLALTSTGEVWGWGYNGFRELGPTAAFQEWTPVRVTGLPPNITDIGCGGTTCYALDDGGALWAWGSGLAGQLGDGRSHVRAQPMRVPGLPSIATFGTGRYHALAEAIDGTLWAWGGDWRGQLGRGEASSLRSAPSTPWLSAGPGGIGETLRLFKTGTEVLFDWDPVVAASLHRLHVDADPAWTGPTVVTSETASEVTLSPDPGTWYYRVSGVDCSGNDLP